MASAPPDNTNVVSTSATHEQPTENAEPAAKDSITPTQSPFNDQPLDNSSNDPTTHPKANSLLNQDPPIPDEAPPLPDEAPPLPDEAPPLPDEEAPPLPDEPAPTQTEWQAIWSPAQNAYYFYNSRTTETTWTNPLDPSASTSSSTPAQPEQEPEPEPTKQPEPEPESGAGPIEQPPADLSYLNGIDPELAYLDPTLAVPSTTAKGPVPSFSARFGARSGAFTAMDGRRPEHLSEAARAQRMSSVYYDTAAWEKEIAERDAQAKADAEAGVGDKRKRVTKADIERFKAQKQAKKTLRNAWLRE